MCFLSKMYKGGFANEIQLFLTQPKNTFKGLIRVLPTFLMTQLCDK